MAMATRASRERQANVKAMQTPATHDTADDGTLGTYDEYAEEYAAYTAQREAADEDPMGILPVMLDLLSNLSGLTALDAGCGEGYLARIMAARGARVTGIDISPRLIQMARDRDPRGAIDYRVADL